MFLNFKKNNDYYLYLFLILDVLLYYLVPFLEFVFLIPLFFYIKNIKKINIKKIILIISISSFLCFLPYYEYGLKFIFVGVFAKVIFFLLFIILTKYFISKKYYLFSIPSIYYILFFIFDYLPTKNFWLNIPIFLNYFPISIRYIGSEGNLFLIILFNINLFEIIFKYLKNKRIKFNLELIILVILVINYFIATLSLFPALNENSKTLKITGIQGNIKQDWFERQKYQIENYNYYINLSNQAIKTYNPQVIIWPEYTFTKPIEFDLNLLNQLNKFSQNNNITLILGSILLENKNISNSKRYNTIYIFNKGKYRTYNAYEPVTIFDPYVKKEEKNQKILISDNTNSINLGLAICFEENFKYIFSNQINQNNAQLFFVIGNQYYITNKIGLKFTSLNSNLRAVENNRYIFRLETSGYSTIIDNNGINVKELPIHKKDILYYEIPIINEKTFYSQNYIIIKIILLIISIICILISIIIA